MAVAVSVEDPGVTGLLDAAAMAILEGLFRRERLSESDASTTLKLIRQSINRLQALELKAISAARRSRIGAADGLVDAGAWVARESHLGGAAAARSVRLASSMESLPYAGNALAGGLISVAHAEVIASATKQLPAELSPVERDRVESALTEQAKSVDPATLRKASRRAVEVAGRSVVEADAHENQVVRTDEEVALLKTTLSMHDNDDGLTVSGRFTVPAFAGSILRKVVQQIAAPRRAAVRHALEDSRLRTRVEDYAGDWGHKYGLALVEVLEHLPTDRLNPKVAATVVVTMELDQLRGQLKIAGSDVGVDLSAGKARQLACTAGLVPAVLAGGSVSLDLGRSNRFFSDAQRTALGALYRSCATVGCDRPYAWSELHHQDPWQHGGRTDLDRAIPLCWFHHRKIHDTGHLHTVSQGGKGIKEVRFRLRT